jgi:hypothetical protein
MNKRYASSRNDATTPANNSAPLMSTRRVEGNGAKHQEAADLLHGEEK